MRQAGIIEEYLMKYREDMKAKEGRALAELILSGDEEGKKERRTENQKAG